MSLKGTFRIEILRCTFLDAKMHTIFNGSYNEQQSIPLYVKTRVVRGNFIKNENNETSISTNENGKATTESDSAAASDLTHFWPGNMPSASDKPYTSVRHAVDWKVPIEGEDEKKEQDTPSGTPSENENENDDDETHENSGKDRVRFVTFTYPVPGKIQPKNSTDIAAVTNKNKKEVSKGKKAKGGKVKNADDSSNITTSTSSIIAPPLVRLPVKKVKQIKPSSHVLQRSQPFNMNESTLTELANSEIVIELWTGEERNPGIEGSSDKLMGTGSMSRIMDKCMTQWPESFETIVELQGLGVGQTSPHVVIKIIPEPVLSNYMLGSRLLTVKNPGLWRMPAPWIWNVVPLESEKEVEEDAKGKKKPAKDNKPEGGFEDPFPYTQSSFVMGISLTNNTDDDNDDTTGTTNDDPPTPHVVYLHGGAVDATSRCACAEASGFIGTAMMEEDDEEGCPTGSKDEISTVSTVPKMKSDLSLVSWNDNQTADFFISADTIKKWNDSNNLNNSNMLSLNIQVARLQEGYSDGVDTRQLHSSSLSENLNQSDSTELTNSGIIEVFTSSIPINALLTIGCVSHTFDTIALQKETHFDPDKKLWLSLLTDENLIKDKRNTEAKCKIEYVRSETERRMKENEDDDIDDSDLPSLEGVATTGEVDSEGDFSQLFASYNQIQAVGPNVSATPATTPLDAVVTIALNKPIFFDTSINPKDTKSGNKGWMKFNRSHSGKNETILKHSALAESRAVKALANEMALLEKALREDAVLNGGTSSSRLSLSTSDYEAFRERMKVQMLTILKAQLSQHNEVAQDQVISMSSVTSGNPLETAPRPKIQKNELKLAIAHTKRTARNVVNKVFNDADSSNSSNSSNTQNVSARVNSRMPTEQIGILGWQSLIEGNLDRAVKLYTDQIQRLEQEEEQEEKEKGIEEKGIEEKENVQKQMTTTTMEQVEMWYSLSKARIQKKDLPGALVSLDFALNMNPEHVDSLTLRSCVDIELQLSNINNDNNDNINNINANSLSFIERATTNKSTRAILVALYRLTNNDTKALQTVMGRTSSPWMEGVSPPRPQSIVTFLHDATRFCINLKLTKLSIAFIDMARAEERNVVASQVNVYPLARAVREAAYRNTDAVVAHVRDGKGRHVSLSASFNAVRASMNVRATERDNMKAASLKRKKMKTKKKRNAMTPMLADEKAAEAASEAANRSKYEMSGATLDSQNELEYLIDDKSVAVAIQKIKCQTPNGKVMYALAQFRQNQLDDQIHTALFKIVDNGNRTGVLWTR